MKHILKEFTRRITLAVLAGTTIMASLSGCGSASAKEENSVDTVQEKADETSGEVKADEASGDVKVVKFGSGTINADYCFIGEDGELTGFEYDIARAIDELLPDYEIELVGSDWSDLISSLQLGNLDAVSWMTKKTPEREEVYLYADDYISSQKFYLVVGANNDYIHSLTDIQDMTVNGATPEEYIHKFWDKYAAEHPEQNINIISCDNPCDDAGIEALNNGSTAALFLDDVSIAGQIRDRGNVIKTVGEPLAVENCYWIFNKEDTEFKEAYDGALKELKANGTYDEIYKKWFSYLEDADFDGE